MEEVELFREYTRLIERKLEMLDADDCCNCNVTMAQCHALVEIGRRQDISLKELAEILELDKSTVSKTVEDLCKKGLITREQLKFDRRTVKINLTDEGQWNFKKIENDMNIKFRDMFERIPVDKRDVVLDALKIYIDSFER